MSCNVCFVLNLRVVVPYGRTDGHRGLSKLLLHGTHKLETLPNCFSSFLLPIWTGTVRRAFASNRSPSRIAPIFFLNVKRNFFFESFSPRIKKKISIFNQSPLSTILKLIVEGIFFSTHSNASFKWTRSSFHRLKWNWNRKPTTR